MKRTLAVDLGAGLVLPTPVMVASGCAGTGRELGGLIDLRKVGAVVSRSITLEPDRGTSTPRIAESASGAVWSTGLQNPGIDAFVAEELPRLARGAHVIVSIAGGSLEAYVRMTGALQGRPDVAALEVHLSAPDVETAARRARVARGPRRRDRRRGRPDVPRAGVRQDPALGERRRRAVAGRGPGGRARARARRAATRAVGPGGAIASRARRRHRVAQRSGDQADDAPRRLRGGARGPRRAHRGGRRDPVGGGRDRGDARRRVGRPGRHGGADRPRGAGPDRPGGRPVPEGQGARVARRRPWPPAGARVVRRPRGGGAAP